MTRHALSAAVILSVFALCEAASHAPARWWRGEPTFPEVVFGGLVPIGMAQAVQSLRRSRKGEQPR